MIIAYTTLQDRKSCAKMAETIVRMRLCACENFHRIESVYLWHGRLERKTEYALLLKARKADYPKIEREIRRMHPYDTPAIFEMPAGRVQKGYLQWMKQK